MNDERNECVREMRASRTTGRAPDDRIDAARRRAASLGIRVDDDDARESVRATVRRVRV
tara:strand:+ start:14014 stop:14190 length:177 start_codon:yes stop_codon:yes gene_type:complete